MANGMNCCQIIGVELLKQHYMWKTDGINGPHPCSEMYNPFSYRWHLFHLLQISCPLVPKYVPHHRSKTVAFPSGVRRLLSLRLQKLLQYWAKDLYPQMYRLLSSSQHCTANAKLLCLCLGVGSLGCPVQAFGSVYYWASRTRGWDIY